MNLSTISIGFVIALLVLLACFVLILMHGFSLVLLLVAALALSRLVP